MKKIYLILLIVLAVAGGVLYLLYPKKVFKGESLLVLTKPSPVQSKTPTAKKSVSFAFAGDAMFDRAVNHYFGSNLTDVFRDFDSSIFENKDIAMANLEGPISPDPIDDNIDPNNLIFNFPPQTSEALKFIHVGAVSLANNHTLNAGSGGFAATKKILTDNSIKFVGNQNVVSDEACCDRI